MASKTYTIEKIIKKARGEMATLKMDQRQYAAHKNIDPAILSKILSRKMPINILAKAFEMEKIDEVWIKKEKEDDKP